MNIFDLKTTTNLFDTLTENVGQTEDTKAKVIEKAMKRDRPVEESKEEN